jgi:hypothetical protein
MGPLPLTIPFDQEFLDIAVAQGEAEIKPDRVLDDLGREAMAAVAERAPTHILSNTPLAPDPVSVTMPLPAPSLQMAGKVLVHLEHRRLVLAEDPPELIVRQGFRVGSLGSASCASECTPTSCSPPVSGAAGPSVRDAST